MKKLFVIGTGRNGSKLTAKIIAEAAGNKNVFGEVHHSLRPVFFKNSYLGNISKEATISAFKNSRDQAIMKAEHIYVEKNHLLVPILNQVITAYPDALFLYVKRNPKDIIRSLYSREVYTGARNMYEDGRLTPAAVDLWYTAWGSMNKFDKVCWYVATMIDMCEDFLKQLPEKAYRVVSYDDFVDKPTVFEPIFNWLGFDFDLSATKRVLNVQQGSSARSEGELSFKVNKNKLKNSQHWKDWSTDKERAYAKFFSK